MDTRRLHAFVKIIDVGSITRASAILHIAQPALSQQIAALEAHFGKPLLLRSKRGVVPTEAGLVLYRHAQLMLRQLEQAQADISSTSTSISGFVSVGLAPLSGGSFLSTRLLKRVRESHPGIVLQINENIGGVISEMIMTGRMDLAFIYDPGEIRGVSFEPVLAEDLYLVSRIIGDGGTQADGTVPGTPEAEVTFTEAAEHNLILPSRIHTVRQLIDTTFSRVGLSARIVAETESVPIMMQAVRDGIGSTILPWSAAFAIVQQDPGLQLRRIIKPNMQTNMSICVSDQLPLSEPASIVSEILTELAHSFAVENATRGVRSRR
ncbi:nitrogen assimilation transcriptional regulator NAC [Phaeovulum sp. W22_SRMD_FR3]|uniref:nitrogen assimilation transcriptional regulator NAC n=1 Tax=Phaeovulum sp. W22_SRMD_FR3 TaxID=3240274 RepID=UPI003F994C7D